jgi:hypothetical protein
MAIIHSSQLHDKIVKSRHLAAGAVDAAALGANSIGPASLVRMTNGQVLVGVTGADSVARTISGDVNVDGTGASTIQAGKILPAMVKASATGVAAGAIPAGAGSIAYVLELDVTDIATGDATYTACPFKFVVTDVEVIKVGAGNVGNNYIVKNGASAITDAIVGDADKSVTRSGTIDIATNVITAGNPIVISVVRTAGSSAAKVILKGHISV